MLARGVGAYLPLLKGKASHVVALEPVKEMHPIIRKEATLAGFEDYQITVLNDTVEEYAASNLTASFDWVLLGNVLCEVNSPTSTLDNVHKLLKEEGTRLFFRTCGLSDWYHLPQSSRCVQSPVAAEPAVAATAIGIRYMPLKEWLSWDVVSWEMNFNTFIGAFVMGLAQKAAV
jgi:2-polyprenyl-3-methyl-5-hydroxy-6-metoxy-1,4-benzoquinol methylase